MNMEFLYALLGTQEALRFFVLVFWAYVGFALSILHELYKGKDDIQETGGFSLVYWWKRNWSRVLLSIVAIPILIRFSENLFGDDPNEFAALLLGFAPDKMFELFKPKK